MTGGGTDVRDQTSLCRVETSMLLLQCHLFTHSFVHSFIHSLIISLSSSSRWHDYELVLSLAVQQYHDQDSIPSLFLLHLHVCLQVKLRPYSSHVGPLDANSALCRKCKALINVVGENLQAGKGRTDSRVGTSSHLISSLWTYTVQ